MGVIEFLCDRRFHQTFTLLPNPGTCRTKSCRISYSDYGDRDSDAVVLMCGALMGGRLAYSPLDQVARKHSVRIIHPDRPGIGGSDPVALEERIPVWLEMVPQLLSHLNIPHVSIASHSGGAIYALNTILTHPNLLHPDNPYACFFAPWVHHSHTKVNQMRATELLPSAAIGKFSSLARFINNNIVPLGGVSSGLVQVMKSSLPRSTPRATPIPTTPGTSNAASGPTSTTSDGSLSDLALDDPEVVEELRKLIVTYLFAETTDGQSADAQLFLKNPRTVSWCSSNVSWSDIDSFVPLFSEAINEESQQSGGRRRWTIDAFHAQDDHMVGKRGRQYFDDCWAPVQPSSADVSNRRNSVIEISRQKGYDYRSEIMKGSDHDRLMDPEFEATDIWLERVRASFSALGEEGDDTVRRTDGVSAQAK